MEKWEQIAQQEESDWEKDYCLSGLLDLDKVLSLDTVRRTLELAMMKKRFLVRYQALAHQEYIDKRNRSATAVVFCRFCGTQRSQFDLKWNDCHNCHIVMGPYDTKGVGYDRDGKPHPIQFDEERVARLMEPTMTMIKGANVWRGSRSWWRWRSGSRLPSKKRVTGRRTTVCLGCWTSTRCCLWTPSGAHWSLR
eukprot:TRINITY_DN48971_c0_g1_i1.p1 TRINITY_DN48971_c0_g1~~TRINITY_DN48971_c0_g1_i1.p1  ORF type:complete len:218 (+),score=34.71 TRINITY_DN48971_c0_g1_i1:73-654(+)